jgi:transcriptional regulator with XRE-family HTH domain
MLLIGCRLIGFTSTDSIRMKEPGLKQFGDRVRALRQKAGLSQEDLAARAGIHRTYIGGVERGERNLGLLNVLRIANALGVPPRALFNGIKGS